MTFILNCTTPTQQFRWLLRCGERARVGKSPWNEFCIEDDETIADEHFSVTYTHQLLLEAIGDSQVKVANQLVTSAQIHGFTSVQIGQCEIQFQPTVSTAPPFTKPSTDPNEFAAPQSGTEIDWPKRSEIIERVGLSSAGAAIIAEIETPADAIQLLSAKCMHEDAMRLVAGCMLIAELIPWCFATLERFSVAAHTKPLRVQAWIEESSEANRLAVANEINWTDNSSPWTWVQAAISWTGGSLSPASNLSLEAPPQQMIVSAIIAALQLASCQANRDEFLQHCIADGLARLHAASGKEY